MFDAVSRFFKKSDVGQGRRAGLGGDCVASAVCLFLSGAALADTPQFTPVDVANHVYDGGWEHFVGGGLAVLDCDGDTRPDLIAAGGSNPPILLRNTSVPHGAVSFEDATPEALNLVATTGVYPLDFDNDGQMDLVVLSVGPDRLLKGMGNCDFAPVSFGTGDHWSTAFSATWEAGQDLPTFAFGHYVDRADPEGPFEACDTNALWRPSPSGYNQTTLAPGHCALSILFTDWSRTGSADLRVSNDRHYYVRDGQEQLWAMDATPRLFTERDGWVRHMLWGMGIATRDLDRDGRDEVFLSSMGDQRLMRRTGAKPSFTDVPFAMGTAAQRPYLGDDGRPSTGWHIAFGDVTNDGRDDVFIAKGNVQQMPGNAMEDPNNLLISQQDGTFSEAGDIAGIASVHRARGAALTDFNADGLLDLAVVNRRAPLEVWQNTSAQTGHWLAVTLERSDVNTQGVGAWIEVDDGASIQAREVTVGGGHAGGVSGPQHFGLGDVDTVRVRVRWPHAAWSEWRTVGVDQVLVVGE
ncbi:MAG: CRTAC1 family protein [Tateyamaria sp.]|uniref:CRTAC1 family protein n=1 Tax=Tateyamaria sp. TaxID=1929288 RepID=UPI00329E7FF0